MTVRHASFIGFQIFLLALGSVLFLLLFPRLGVVANWSLLGSWGGVWFIQLWLGWIGLKKRHFTHFMLWPVFLFLIIALILEILPFSALSAHFQSTFELQAFRAFHLKLTSHRLLMVCTFLLALLPPLLASSLSRRPKESKDASDQKSHSRKRIRRWPFLVLLLGLILTGTALLLSLTGQFSATQSLLLSAAETQPKVLGSHLARGLALYKIGWILWWPGITLVLVGSLLVNFVSRYWKPTMGLLCVLFFTIEPMLFENRVASKFAKYNLNGALLRQQKNLNLPVIEGIAKDSPFASGHRWWIIPLKGERFRLKQPQSQASPTSRPVSRPIKRLTSQPSRLKLPCDMKQSKQPFMAIDSEIAFGKLSGLFARLKQKGNCHVKFAAIPKEEKQISRKHPWWLEGHAPVRSYPTILWPASSEIKTWGKAPVLRIHLQDGKLYEAAKVHSLKQAFHRLKNFQKTCGRRCAARFSASHKSKWQDVLGKYLILRRAWKQAKYQPGPILLAYPNPPATQKAK